ncbi:MAG: ABC transporter ATP-binding protein [Pleurocapsa minor HA4230-MV1]|jgi:iron(III) transport system ATP-binding protein|nr:ABC transporter ATP-binding protein [Pleurocapsa minor HA4230-MV1]
MNQSVILQLNNITKTYPGRASSGINSQSMAVLNDVSLTLNHGELLGLLGPSGCGKTTLLRIVAGFESISQGTVAIAGKVICTNCESLAAEKRQTGMVFQDYALFPHLTVAENIAFGLKRQHKNLGKGLFSRQNQPQIKQRVREILQLVGLEGFEQRYPHQLSGGQQQRISLARALAPEPALILLDEPLSNLDVQVRHRLRAEIRAILKAAGTSAIFVTHDREEALAISDKIAVMRQGKIEQVGTPEEIYLNPATHFVAEFVTQANFLPATKQGQVWVTEIGEITAPSQTNQATTGDLMLRPEDITLVADPNSKIVVRSRQFLGREYYYAVETASGKIIYVRMGLATAIAVGEKVSLSFNSDTPQIFAKG